MTTQQIANPETMHATIVKDQIFPYDETDDPSKRTHFVRGEENEHLWTEGMDAQDLVETARLLGDEITALCGHKWVPKYNPDKHEICKACEKIWRELA